MNYFHKKEKGNHCCCLLAVTSYIKIKQVRIAKPDPWSQSPFPLNLCLNQSAEVHMHVSVRRGLKHDNFTSTW